MDINSIKETFGVSTEPVKSYVERVEVDDSFKSALNEDKHIIIYGSSKQGKTALVNRYASEDRITVGCTPETQTIDIYKSILRRLKIGIKSEIQKTEEDSSSIGANVVFKLSIPNFLEVGGGITPELGSKETSTESYSEVEYNLNLAQDMSELLNSIDFKNDIVLENFHYLSEEVQGKLSFDLRLFQENGIRFIILGIWQEKNRLIQFNGDLVDRVKEIPVEPWKIEDFSKVIQQGEKNLDITFDEDAKNEILNNSFKNIGIVQELCKESCIIALNQKLSAISLDIVKRAEDIKTQDYMSRHLRALESIADAGHITEGLFMPYYLILVLLKSDISELESGISRTEIHRKIRELHHRPHDVRASDISYLLHTSLVTIQTKKKIVPPLFDYDRNSRILRLIDSTLLFFLCFSDKDIIVEEIPDPTPSN